MALFPYGIPKTEKKAISKSNDLFADWEKTKSSLVEGLSADRARAMNTILENTRSYLNQPAGQPSTAANLQDMRKIMLPMIRKIMPTVIANHIIGVQPMSGFARGLVKLIISQIGMHWNCKFYTMGLPIEILSDIQDWVKDNVPKEKYWFYKDERSIVYSFNFYDEQDVVAFKLKWDGAGESTTSN